jgi:hypothetical protein
MIGVPNAQGWDGMGHRHQRGHEKDKQYSFYHMFYAADGWKKVSKDNKDAYTRKMASHYGKGSVFFPYIVVFICLFLKYRKESIKKWLFSMEMLEVCFNFAW